MPVRFIIVKCVYPEYLPHKPGVDEHSMPRRLQPPLRVKAQRARGFGVLTHNHLTRNQENYQDENSGMAGYARPPGNLAVEIEIFTEFMSRLLRDSGNSFFPAQLIRSIPETQMLSPHEFATLMLVKDASDSIELDRAELDALLERQLVALEKLASRGQRFRITFDGDSILQAVARIR